MSTRKDEGAKGHPAVKGFKVGVKVSYTVVKGTVRGVLRVRHALGSSKKDDVAAATVPKDRRDTAKH